MISSGETYTQLTVKNFLEIRAFIELCDDILADRM